MPQTLQPSTPLLMNPRYFSHRLTGLILLLSLILRASSAHALPDANPPPHSVSPELSGLNVSYFVKKDRITINLYLINHEAFDITCDTQYLSGSEKQDAREKILSPGKADKFKYNYGRHSDNVRLKLACKKTEPDPEPATQPE